MYIAAIEGVHCCGVGSRLYRGFLLGQLSECSCDSLTVRLLGIQQILSDAAEDPVVCFLVCRGWQIYFGPDRQTNVALSAIASHPQRVGGADATFAFGGI